jgi:hypothetical protein
MRLAEMARDYWQLRSGEASHLANPDVFWIPPLAERQGLRRGDAAKLIFDIESEDEDGGVQLQGERMWVIVAEQRDGTYIGILDNPPASIEPADSTYLREGAEVAFLAEHVIDIDQPPSEYAEWRLSQPPTRRWPPEGDVGSPAA